MSRFDSIASLFALVVGILLSAGCAVAPIAQTAQRGSTIVVPLGNEDVAKAFGGTQISDPVRGEMVYYLQDSGGPIFELTTRGSALAAPHPASSHARLPVLGNYQMLSAVDIPQSAPYGAHQLYARRRLNGAWVGDPVLIGPLKILPATVTWTDQGTTYNVTAQSTYLPGAVQYAMPDPQIVVTLAAAAYAASIRIGQNYGFYNPFASNYEVVDAFQTDLVTSNNHRPIAKLELEPGPVPVGRFVSATGDPFYQVAFVFQRKSATAPPFSLDDIYFEITTWDENGVARPLEYLFPEESPERMTIR